MVDPPEIWPRDALPKGTVLNGYRLERVIGRGGFGITYRGSDAIDQVFAVKECFPRQFATRQGTEVFPGDPTEAQAFDDCLARFTKEAKALKQLSSVGAAGDGVVKVATFFEANGTAYIVMEYLTGESLDSVIKAQPGGLPEEQVRFLLPRLLHAVGCVHDAGLLHRDIKPANIFLRDDGRPVLIDFGAARSSIQGQTVTYTQIFSEGYAPIEQFAGTRQGPFSDIYALGATLYRVIGGTTVDSFTRHQAVLRGKRDPQIPAVKVGAGRYSPALLKAIDAAMTVDPEDRPRSVHDLQSLLSDDTVAADLPLRAPPKHPPQPPLVPSPSEIRPELRPEARPPQRRSRIGLVIALVLVAAVLIGGGAWGVMWLQAHQTEALRDAEEAGRRAAAEEAERKAAADKQAADAAAASTRRATAAQAAAKGAAERARAVVAALGLDAKTFLGAADALLAQGDSELTRGAFDAAVADFTKASALIGPATNSYLEQQAVASAKLSQTKLAAGDTEGAQAALTLARKIRQAESGMQ